MPHAYKLKASDMIKANILRAGEEPNTPASAMCSPVTLFLSQVGNPQTTVITGTDSLDVEATSLGNTGVQDSAVVTEQFQTTTDEVKFEVTVIKDTTTSTASLISPGFSQGVAAMCGVSYSPNVSGGRLIDIETGGTLVTGIGATLPYTIAVYIKADGTARYADSESNSGALSVDAAYSNLANTIIFSTVNAGDTSTEELDIRFNAGSSSFTVGEDAERWCNV